MERKLKLPPAIQKIGGIFLKNGFTLYVVGGYVRNMLLELPVTDCDICSKALPSEAAGFLRADGMRVYEKALEFGTIEIHFIFEGKKYSFEHTTFRSDTYGPGGTHRPERVYFTDDVFLDAVRRDFTVNALYADAVTGEVVDVLKRGFDDLMHKRIAAAHQEPYETLKDDGLRLMRLVRFACELGFEIDGRLMNAARENSALLKDISKERIQTELIKIALSDTKYPEGTAEDRPHKGGLLLLDALGLLPYILPSLLACKNVFQNKKFHAYDVFMHCIESFAVSVPDLNVRLASLLHDVGKPVAISLQGNMHGHEKIGAEIANRELKDLRFGNKTVNTVMLLIKNHMFDLDNRARPDTVRKRVAILGTHDFKLLIDVRRADFIGSGKDAATVDSADKWQAVLSKMVAENTPLHVNDLKISGEEIMQALNIPAGPMIGLIKERLLKICLLKPAQNDRLHLLQHARQIYGSIAEKQNKH